MRAAPIFAACMVAMLTIADVKARVDLRTMSCAAARERVFLTGAEVFTTGENTYERFVEGQLQCQPFDEIAVPAVAATRDNPQCWIGYICRNRSDFNSGD